MGACRKKQVADAQEQDLRVAILRQAVQRDLEK